MNENTNERKSLPYAQYKQEGNPNRKFRKVNKFKSKIYSLIKESKKDNIEINKALKIMFGINHLEAHTDFLQSHFEDEPNYYKTYANIKKCKNRAIGELLFHTNCVEVMVNKRGKTDKRLWLAVFKVTYKELTVICVTNYKDIEMVIGRLDMEETDIDKPTTMLIDEEKGARILDTQMYFTNSLKEMLDRTDLEVQKLMKWSSLYKNNNQGV